MSDVVGQQSDEYRGGDDHVAVEGQRSAEVPVKKS
jgi:hypothetical protein